MYWILMTLALVFSSVALADGPELGDDCTLAWEAPATGPTPRGYIMRWGPTSSAPTNEFIVGDVLTIQCNAIGIDQAGQYHAVVVAFNNLGESASSNEVPFLFSVPATPGTLSVGP